MALCDHVVRPWSMWSRTRAAAVIRPMLQGHGHPSGAVLFYTFPPWLSCLPDCHRSTPGVGPVARRRSVSISVAVDADVGVASHLRGQQHRVQTGRLGGEHGEALKQVRAPGRPADRVVLGQLRDAGAVDHPPDHQGSLLETAQRPGPGAGGQPLPFDVRKAGQERDGRLAYGQDGGVYEFAATQNLDDGDPGKDYLHSEVLRLFIAPRQIRPRLDRQPRRPLQER